MQQFLELTIDKFVFRVATDRLYSAEGVWVKLEENGARVGVTDFLQQRSGDAAFVRVKPEGSAVAAGDEFAELETIKVNQSLFAPLGGTIAEVNASLESSPELINQDPYGRGWLAVVKVDKTDAAEAKLLDAEAYLAVIRSQAEEEIG
jgi:glycine cleavage system H protein